MVNLIPMSNTPTTPIPPAPYNKPGADALGLKARTPSKSLPTPASAGEVEFRQVTTAPPPAEVPAAVPRSADAESLAPSQADIETRVAQSPVEVETPSPASLPPPAVISLPHRSAPPAVDLGALGLDFLGTEDNPVELAPPAPPKPVVEHFFVATFAIKNPGTGKIITDIVEVPHTQKPKADQNAAWALIRQRFPHVPNDNIRRTGGRIISRPGGKLPTIELEEGMTIRQIFPDGSPYEASRTVGTVIFEGALCDVILRHIRSKSVFAVTLRQPGGTVVNFSRQITTMRLAADLEQILTGELGAASKTMRLYFKTR